MTAEPAELAERELRPAAPYLRRRALELGEKGHEEAAACLGAIVALPENRDRGLAGWWTGLEAAPHEERMLAFRVLYETAAELREDRPKTMVRLVELVEASGDLYGLPGEPLED